MQRSLQRVLGWIPVAALTFALPAHAAPPPIQSKTLANGLEVFVVEDHSQPLVNIEIAFKNGSMTEPRAFNGLSHLYEHMFFKANKELPDQEAWLKKARALGMVWNGTTDTERVNYFFSTTTDHLAGTMAFMRDAVVSPLFDPKELAREKVVVTGEIDRDEASPTFDWYIDTERRVFYGSPTRKDPLGTRASVLAATPAKMRTIERRYYIPNNGALFVTGDVSAEQIFEMAAKLYAGWKRGPDPFIKFPLVKFPKLPFSSVVLVLQPVEAVAGRMVFQGPSSVPQEYTDTYAADLIGFATAEPSSPFQRNLVDSGACLQASFSWETQRNVGPVTIEFQATPEKAKDCIRAVRAKLVRMKSPDYFTSGALKNAAFRAEVEQALNREKSTEFSHVLSFYWASATIDYYLSYVENLRKTGYPQIASFLDRWILGKPFVLGVLESPGTAKAGLDQATLEKFVGGRPWPTHTKVVKEVKP